VQSTGFRVWGLGSRPPVDAVEREVAQRPGVLGLGCGVLGVDLWGCGLNLGGSGLAGWGLGFRILGSGFRV